MDLFFYFLDYATPTENFQIADPKKKIYVPYLS